MDGGIRFGRGRRRRRKEDRAIACNIDWTNGKGRGERSNGPGNLFWSYIATSGRRFASFRVLVKYQDGGVSIPCKKGEIPPSRKGNNGVCFSLRTHLKKTEKIKQICRIEVRFFFWI